ncbi:TPA: DNA translocase FtsK [Pseudomonas aeruginosa]|uniref:FtsK/SpoIIIE domain-containing protein n=1 Tax=Pseudomonas aeruginosa TaxID=287 RepID=UPI00228C9CD4|nr:DNA translocase FtsK [Pseudomonas aeruginosa]HCF2752374.1 DNA translocase FtsK [Pseudomonas aeruginosa]HCF6369470.1 DNA translocase FtsK [Pseudomonas aeruginosa]HCW1144959.1 DNA translocase FtsK [Pseudomonas aeruginosa]
MIADRIVGRVGAVVLKKRIAEIDSTTFGGSARFRLDRLSPAQIAAVVREVVADPDLALQVDVKIPSTLVLGERIPAETMIVGNAGLGRNLDSDKLVLLTANGDEPGIADTVAWVTALGAKEFKSHGDAWAEAAAKVVGVSPTPDDMRVFRAALSGLLAVKELDLPLKQAGDYSAAVATAIHIDGLPIRQALGNALPLLGLPRDTSLFASDRTFGHLITPWRKAFEKLAMDRAPLLQKLRKNGQLIDRTDMVVRYEGSEVDIPEAVRPIIRAFIQADPGDAVATRALSELEWEQDGVHLIFERPKDRQQGLAAATLEFFDYDKPGVLENRWKDHLEELKAREKRSDWQPEDEEFFELHRSYIEEDASLRARWEKAVFGKPVECFDFLDGFLTAVQRLVIPAGAATGDRFLRVRVRRGKKEWRTNFNHDAGAFFSMMYRGIEQALGERVEWKLDGQGSNSHSPLFDYPRFFEEENRTGRLKPCNSLSRQSLQIKFEVHLVDRIGETTCDLGKTQLVWSMRPDAIGFALHDDVTRLLERGGCACTDVPRKLVSQKGASQNVSLLDVGTLEATFGRDAGTLVPPASRLGSMRKEIKGLIDELERGGRYTLEQRDEIRSAWDIFEAAYIQALKDFVDVGLHADIFVEQAGAFGALLRTLLTHARGDICRGRLVARVLAVGTARLTGGGQALIIPPWHPERLKALSVKTRRCAGLIGHMLLGDNVSFGNRNIFFREFTAELEHPFYPEIALATHGAGLILVSETATVNGYSLMEPPERDEGGLMTDVLPGPAAKEIRELLERYVDLQPHEAANLSVLLYDADAAALPIAAIRELEAMQTSGGFQCNVAVRHRKPEKLRGIYSDLVAKGEQDPDLPVVSETSDNFMSKLRVSVSPPGSNPPRTADGFKPFDITFLHDVVARTASVEWLPVDCISECADLEHAPSRWSYRGVSGEDELKAATFLTCPRQTRSGRAWVDAVGAVSNKKDYVMGSSSVPARRISLQDEELRSMLDEAHGLSEWVATYDELLDKRQLRANGITVVRYRRQQTNGRNVIVSSTSDLRLLTVLVKRRIQELGLTLNGEPLDVLATRFVEDALSISGDIVLRAAKRGVSAGELLGLVLSRWIIQNEFVALCRDNQPLTVFFLLDDYATWLAYQENRIADLLGVCLEEDGDGIRLHLAVVESKYVSASKSAEARKSSKTQLVATLTTLDEAIFGDPGRLDRDLWLARLSDLLLDAAVQPGQTGLLERARSAIRDGNVSISLRGYSQVFIHSHEPGGVGPDSERLPVDCRGTSVALQEVFDRPELRRLVEAYANSENPVSIRAGIGHDTPWTLSNTRPPARRVTWTEMVGRLIPAPRVLTDLPLFADLDPPTTAAPSGGTAMATPVGDGAQPDNQNDFKDEAASPSISEEGARAPASLDAYGSVLNALIASKSAGRADSGVERAAWAEESTRKLRTALNSYGLQAQVIGTRLTPNGCLVRLAGSDRLRVADLEARRMQLLTTHAIQLVTVQPKPGEIVVTLAGEERQAVSLWDVWTARKANRNASGINVSLVLGVQELNGSVLYLNLGGDFGGLSQHEPHSLIAGATGSGKSVLVQAMLLDIAATNSSRLAKIIVIDPKMGVDYVALDTLPHLREPIVTEKDRAAVLLSEIVEEMESRYKLFAAARVRDLATYNATVPDSDRLPMLFLVHDEFTDWMLDPDYKAAVGAAVQRLGVKARAAGIHLFFAAQRPDKDVMPMQLRDNLGNRLILKVASEATSKIVLDRGGAEQLLGRGHLAARLAGEQGLVYAQAPYLSDADIALAVEAIIADDSEQLSVR